MPPLIQDKLKEYTPVAMFLLAIGGIIAVAGAMKYRVDANEIRLEKLEQMQNVDRNTMSGINGKLDLIIWRLDHPEFRTP